MLWDRYLRQTLNPPSLPDFSSTEATGKRWLRLVLGRAVLAVPDWAVPVPAVPGALVKH